MASCEEGIEVKKFDCYIFKHHHTFGRASQVLCFNSVCPLREKSMALDKDDVIQVKEAFKWIMQGRVAKELGGVAVVTRVGDPHKEEEKKVYVKEDVLIIIN